MKNKKWDVLYIVWEDSYHAGGWRPLDQAEIEDNESLVQISVGFYVGETERTTSICQSAKASPRLREASDTFVDQVLTIPKKAIIKQKILSLRGANTNESR